MSKEAEPAPMMLISHLLYESRPQIERSHLAEKLRTVLPNARLLDSKDNGETLLIVHENALVEYAGGQTMPAQTAIVHGGSSARLNFDASLQQTWDWRDANEVIQRAQHHLFVTEMMARGLPPAERVRIYAQVLHLVVGLTSPLCINAHHADKLIQTKKLQTVLQSDRPGEYLHPFLNVRLFRIEERREGELLMDTRGLAALGLPDLQMHFVGLNPSEVAGALYNTAIYIFENGDCIEDGHTIAGISPEDKWSAHHEMALVGPERVVIDLDPGDPYAAGNRKRA